MKEMKLEFTTRKSGSKSEIAKLRREGAIPAIIYGQGKEASATITLKNSEFMAAMRNVAPGRLPTTVFSLVDAKGKPKSALIKEIQYHPTTYNVEHIDFIELHDKKPINVKVPIECTGVADCTGIKLGGTLRQVIRHMRVRCLPKDMPEKLEIDIQKLALFESKRLADLTLPNNVRSLDNLQEVAIVIVKR